MGVRANSLHLYLYSDSMDLDLDLSGVGKRKSWSEGRNVSFGGVRFRCERGRMVGQAKLLGD